MSNRRKLRRDRQHQLSAEGRMPVAAYSADELHRFLVEDAVNYHATDLPWMVAALRRIAKLQRRPLDGVYLSVENEVIALTGRGLPVYSGPTIR